MQHYSHRGRTHCSDVHGQRELKHAVQANVIVLYDVLKSNQYTSRQSQLDLKHAIQANATVLYDVLKSNQY